MVRSFWKRTLVVALSCGGAGWVMAQQPPVATQPPAGNIISIDEPGKGKQEYAILREWPLPDGNVGRILMNLSTGEQITVVDSGAHPVAAAPSSPGHRLGARIFRWGPNQMPPAEAPMPPDVDVALAPQPAVTPQPAPGAVVVDGGMTPMPVDANPAAAHRRMFGSSWELSWRKGASGSTMPGSTMTTGDTVVAGDAGMAPGGSHRTPFASLFGRKQAGEQVIGADGTPVVVTQASPGTVGAEPKVTVIPLDGPAPNVVATTAAAPPKKPLWPFHMFSGASAPKDAQALSTGESKDSVVAAGKDPTASRMKEAWPPLAPGEVVVKDVPLKDKTVKPATPKETVVKETVAKGTVVKETVVKDASKDKAVATQSLDSNPWNRYKGPYTSLTAANAATVTTEAGQSSDWRRSWGKTSTADGQGSLAVKADDKDKKADATAAAAPKPHWSLFGTAAAKADAPKKETAKAAPPKDEAAKVDPPKHEVAKVDPPKKEVAKVDPPKKEAVKKDEKPAVAVTADPPAPPAPPKPRVEVAVDLPRAQEQAVDPLDDPAKYSRHSIDTMIAANPAVPAALAANPATARGLAKLGKAPTDAGEGKSVSRWSKKELAGSKPGPELMSASPTAVAAAPAKPATESAKESAKVPAAAQAVIAKASATEVKPTDAKLNVSEKTKAIIAKAGAVGDGDGKVVPASAEAGVASTQPAMPLGAKSVLSAYDARGGGVVYLPVPMVTLPPSSYVPPPAPAAEEEKPTAKAAAPKADPTQDDLSANAFGPAVAPQPAPEEQMAYNAFTRQPQPGMFPPQGMMPPGMMPPQGMMPQGMMPPMVAMGPMGQPVYQAAGYGYPGMVVPAMVPPMAQPAYGQVVPAAAPPAGPQTVPQLLYSLREALYPSVRQRAAESLATYDSREHPEVIEALLLAAREDPAGSVRAGCVRSLTRVGKDSATVKSTIEGLRTDPDAHVRQEAEDALAKMTGPGATSPVQPASAVAPARP